MEQAKRDLEGLVAKLQEEIFEIRGETTVLNRDMTAKQEQLSDEREKIARLQGDLTLIQGEFASSRDLSEVQGIVEGRMLAAQQGLSEEMKRLLGRDYRRPRSDNVVGGIPVDSEYVIFIIRHVRKHAAFRVAARRQEDVAGAGHLPQGQGHSGHERHGAVHVPALRRQVDSGHPGAAQGDTQAARRLESVLELEPRGRHHPGHSHLCQRQPQDQPLRFRRRVLGRLDRVRRGRRSTASTGSTPRATVSSAFRPSASP